MSGTIAFPPNPTVGQTYQFGGATWVWNGTVWTIAGASQSFIVVGPNAPSATNVGQLWWNTTDAQLYVWTGSNWVVVVNPPGVNPADYVAFASGGTMAAPLALQGVTDGSSAPAGMVGEYMVGNNGANGGPLGSSQWSGTAGIILTPGDWDVQGMAFFQPTVGLSSAQAGIVTSNGGAPTFSTAAGLAQSGGVATTFVTMPAAPLGQMALATAVARWNVTANQSLWLSVWANYTSGSCTAVCVLRARRIR